MNPNWGYLPPHRMAVISTSEAWEVIATAIPEAHLGHSHARGACRWAARAPGREYADHGPVAQCEQIKRVVVLALYYDKTPHLRSRQRGWRW